MEVKKYMPNEKILAQKKQVVEELTDKLKYQAGVLVDYKGISVNDDTAMRVKLREANVDYSVIKNSMMRFAIKNVGFDEMDSILIGSTSLAVSNEDSVAPARLIKEHADKFNGFFEIKGGFMDGKVLSVNEVISLAKIPPLPILQAQFLGTLLAPITTLAIVLKAAAEKGGATDEAPAEAAEEAAPAEEAPAEAAEEAAPAEEAPAEATEEAAPAEEATE
jgi:large subunit ribosomal protein L10